MAKTTGDKELEKIYQELKSATKDNSYSSHGSSYGSDSSEGGDLLKFFIGLLLLGGGLFMIFNNLTVTSTWGGGGYFFHIGSFNLPNGMVMLPMIAGIAMLFLMDRKIFGWIVLAIGILIVLLSVLLTTRIYWRSTSAYVFVIMFGMTAAGAGMVLRELFRKR
ncbi:MAG TPA: hypothetical protein P5191_10350 [Ruminococcus sp.]|nr:hypothetical protein [Ruminococcus sp.]